MNTESLKKLAEAMGYAHLRVSYNLKGDEPKVVGYPAAVCAEAVFNPPENPAQLLEVFLWALNEGGDDDITMEQFITEVMEKAEEKLSEQEIG